MAGHENRAVGFWRCLRARTGHRLRRRNAMVERYRFHFARARNSYQDRLQGASPDQAAGKIAALEAKIKRLEPRPQRHLSEEQKQKLVTAMTPLAKDITFIFAYSDSPESSRYAVDFMKAFKQADINSFGPAQTFTYADDEKGVLVGLIDPANPSELAKKYIAALRDSGIKVKMTRWGSDITPMPQLNIGSIHL
jgi:hypothetical protein